MSGKSKAKTADKPLIELVYLAIKSTKDKRNGASRAAIKNYVLANSKRVDGAHLNTYIRKAIDNALKKGILKEGSTIQRFKIGDQPLYPPKKKISKKPAKKAVKKTSKKKTPTKKKSATKKKTPSKKKASKKKVVKKKTPKKKTPKKGGKRTSKRSKK
mmetsp:Transcript_101972/g.124781  ORF Transcript_101972/g.124781 Transcript_101972/m.124781 type:complete len:158 (+) Transcript_101972:50-523(+)